MCGYVYSVFSMTFNWGYEDLITRSKVQILHQMFSVFLISHPQCLNCIYNYLHCVAVIKLEQYGNIYILTFYCPRLVNPNSLSIVTEQ